MQVQRARRRESRPPDTQQTIGEIMTDNPLTLPETASLRQAARAMRDANIGAVLVCNGSDDEIKGIVTDRDIVVRAIADGQDPNHIPLSRVMSKPEYWLGPNATVDEAVQMMGAKWIRRIPIVEDGHAIGVVSLGDLAAIREPESVLGQISTAPPTH